MKNFKISITMLLFLTTLFSCEGQSADATAELLKESHSDSVSLKVLVITKVKKPWYAWHSLVAGKMKKSIPEYQQIMGLKEKYFSFTQDQKLFGGIYFWEKKTDAENWFNKAWFERIEKTYGKKGIAEYYDILSVTQIAKVAESSENLYGVISYQNVKNTATLGNIEGILKYVSLLDTKQKKCSLTVWKDRETALNYFGNTSETYFFDIPLFIINAK